MIQNTRTKRRIRNRGLFFAWLHVFGTLINILWTYYLHFRSQEWCFYRTFGLFLTIPSFFLWSSARITLGYHFSVQPLSTSTFVAHGLYKCFRNPMYISSSIFLVGYFLTIRRPLWIFVMTVLVPLQIYRSRREAEELKVKFGLSYDNYCNAVIF